MRERKREICSLLKMYFSLYAYFLLEFLGFILAFLGQRLYRKCTYSFATEVSLLLCLRASGKVFYVGNLTCKAGLNFAQRALSLSG